MNQLRAELGWITDRCRRRFRSAQALSLAFKALNLALLAPLSAAILHFCLSRWGRASVGNFELVAFFVSPVGIAALLGVGAVLLATLYLELSGLIRVLADGRLHWWQAFKSSTGLLHRLIELGLRQLALYLALALPFLAGIGLVYWLLWHGKDLNGLIILKPPVFWLGAGLAGAIAVAYLLLALRCFLQRIYAVPILTFESKTSPREALESSIERSRGRLFRTLSVIAAWAAISSLVTIALLGLLDWALLRLIGRGGSSLSMAAVVTGTALAIHTVAAMLLSVVANVTFAATLLSLYRQVAPDQTLGDDLEQPQPSPKSLGWMVGGVLLVLAGASVIAGYLAIRDLKLNESLEITAHRAGAAGAPENTVAALKQAIVDRADWAEIDVQLTADKALVVMHDIDLARVGGGNRRVDQATLAEIQALDVGASFGPNFAGERIPTLGDILAAAKGKIRLNVELKPHGKSDADELTRRTIEELQSADMVPNCRLCSQSYESLQLARQIEPRLPVGYIVATSVGDIAKLDVDFLMVKGSLVTRQLVDRARLRNIAVHAWTVNDPAEVGPLLDAGVANLITDKPAPIRAEFDEIRALDVAPRLILRTRHSLSN